MANKRKTVFDLLADAATQTARSMSGPEALALLTEAQPESVAALLENWDPDYPPRGAALAALEDVLRRRARRAGMSTIHRAKAARRRRRAKRQAGQ